MPVVQCHHHAAEEEFQVLAVGELHQLVGGLDEINVSCPGSAKCKSLLNEFMSFRGKAAGSRVVATRLRGAAQSLDACYT